MSAKHIGMIVPTMDNSFFSSLAVQVEKAMADRGYQTWMASCHNDAEREKEYLRSMADLNMEGIICVSGLSDLPKDLLSKDLPLVWVDRVPASSKPVPWVANDDAHAMEMAVDHLIMQGSSKILLLPGFLAEQQESPRVQGYRRSLEKHGIDFRQEYILQRSGIRSSEEETGELIRSLFASGLTADGLITSSDRAAFGAVRALQSIGYFVPEDVRLISFDNSSYSAMASPSVSSLDRKTDRLAEKACEILCRLMAGEKDVPMENIIEVTLQQRDSSR